MKGTRRAALELRGTRPEILEMSQLIKLVVQPLDKWRAERAFRQRMLERRLAAASRMAALQRSPVRTAATQRMVANDGLRLR